MNQGDFISRLKRRLQEELPGYKAHEKVLPIGRTAKIPENAYKSAKKSAVALVLFENEKQCSDRVKCWSSLLIQRPIYEGYHSGQVCFPGGKCDESDESALSTALRECEEETGIRKEKLNIIGELSPVYIPVSNFLIEPFLFHLTEESELIPDEREVHEIFEFELEKDLKNNLIDYTTIELSPQRKLSEVPYFPIKDKVIWGATALILAEFQEILSEFDQI